MSNLKTSDNNLRCEKLTDPSMSDLSQQVLNRSNICNKQSTHLYVLETTMFITRHGSVYLR